MITALKLQCKVTKFSHLLSFLCSMWHEVLYVSLSQMDRHYFDEQGFLVHTISVFQAFKESFCFTDLSFHLVLCSTRFSDLYILKTNIFLSSQRQVVLKSTVAILGAHKTYAIILVV